MPADVRHGLVPVSDLACPADLAEHLGVVASAVHNWRARHRDFPRPLYAFGSVLLFRRSEVEAWHRARREAGAHRGGRPAGGGRP